MGEYFPGKMVIGGEIPEQHLNELAIAILDTGGSRDWDTDPIKDVQEIHELVRQDAHGQLWIYDAGASYGHFEDLEAWCQEHCLAYRVYSDARYEFDANILAHDVDGKCGESLSTQYAQPSRDIESLEASLKAGTSLEDVITGLKWFLPEAVPPLTIKT
jgi:hypothetical protein